MLKHVNHQAALYIVFAELFLVCSGMSIKQVSGEVSTEIIVFVRNLFALVLLLPILVHGGLKLLRTNYLRLHILRAVVGVSAMTCLFYSWGHLPLAEAALLKQTAPFFMPLFAFWWLGERITMTIKLGIFIGFIGVYLVLNPTGASMEVAVLIGLCGAMLGAFAKVVLRRMGPTEPARRIVIYFALFSALVAAIPAALNWQTPNLIQSMYLILVAITSTLAQLLLSRGYALAPAGQMGPYTYASVAFAAFFGWLFWDEVLDMLTMLGIGLIVFAGALSINADRKPAEVI